MKVLAFGTAAFAAVILAGGCSASDSTKTQVQAIQGGTLDTKDSFAVGVCAGSGPGQCQLFCSGALIAPNLVMTARHCVNQPSSQSIDCASTTFGGQYTSTSDYFVTTNSSMLQGSLGWHQAKTIWTTTGTKVCGNDMALIELVNNVSLSEAGGQFVTPVVQYSMTDHTKYSTTVTAIGYGDTSATQQDPGTRYQLQNVNLACIPGDSVIDCGQQTQLTANEFVSGNGTCEGESGSSAYEQKNFNKNIAVSFGVPLARRLERRHVRRRHLHAHRRVGDVVHRAGAQPAASDGITPRRRGRKRRLRRATVGRRPRTAEARRTAQRLRRPASLGAPCSDPSDCNSGLCLSDDNGTTYICSATCNSAGDGSDCGQPNYQCVDDGTGNSTGWCFPKPSDSSFNNQSGGCAMGGKSDPSKPVPWGTVAIAGAWLFAFGVRRRNKR